MPRFQSIQLSPARVNFGLWPMLALIIFCFCAPAAPIQKVIHQYALTSANDFPQRDPMDWRLLASNNGGKTWATLDARTNELFGARQQRKLYKIANESAFSMYRLEIDRVRDPLAVSSVQLAEIELMGDSENDQRPTPAFTDEISAQGDNPPGETVANLFDGRVETKWLDWTTNESTRSSWIQWQYKDPAESVATNINQLLALHERASNGIPARIAAVAAGEPSAAKQICLVDTTGCVILDNVGAQTALAGKNVVIDGVVRWVDGRISLKEGSLQVPASSDPSIPEAISLGQALPKNENLKWVQVEGVIRYPHLAGSEISFDLEDEQSSMRVYYPSHDNSPSLPPAGTKVSARGVCVGGFNERGQWVAASLWIAGPEALSRIDTNTEDETPPVVPTRQKKPLSDPTGFLTIAQIRQLGHEKLKNDPRVKFRGVVTDELQGFVQDDTAGIEVLFSTDAKLKGPKFGTYIAVDGRAELDDFGGPIIWADQIEVLGNGKLPRPQKLTPGQLASGQTDAQWIDVDGVVRTTDGSHLLITSYNQEVMATITEAPVKLVENLVDAEVHVSGVGVTARDDQGRVQGIHMLIPSLDYVDVLIPAPKTETLPVRKIGSLVGLSGPGESLHRVKVEGIVTLQQNQRLFLQDDTGNAMAILQQNVVLDARFGRRRWLYWQTSATEPATNSDVAIKAGDRIQVLGFPETHRYSPVLTQAIIRRVGSRQRLTPVPLTLDGLTEGGLDSGLVTFDGDLRSQTAIGANVILDMEWQDRTLQVLLPRQEEDSFKIANGSRLRVSGVCQIDPPSYPALGLIPGPVRILTRSLGDLVVLASPSWWTVRRALMLMGGMSLLILAGLLWIRELRRQVGERTTQLVAEIQLRERAESRHALEQERARIAKDLHDDLGANLTQIVFLSERVEVAGHDGQEVKRWFDLIPATARRTIQSLDEIVWAINPWYDSLESLANYLSQFAQQHLTLANVRCVLDIPTVLPSVPLSTEVRHNLLLMTREALQNAVTHAGATEVHLSLKLDDDTLTIAVADNGKGFEPRSVPPHSNGLHNMQQRVEAIGGRMEIKSTPGRGAIVSFLIPRSILHGRVIGRGRVTIQN